MSTDPAADSIAPFLGALASPSKTARERLLAHVQPRLIRMIRRTLRKFPGVWRWEDEADVMQNVLLRLDRALQEVTPPTSADFLALASAHIRWELTDMARRHNGPAGLNALYLTPANDEDGGRRPVDPPAPAQDPLGLEIWSELHEKIAEMPDGPRQLFDALFYRGLQQSEAAEFLGMPLRTLRRRWRQAREKLAEEFGDDLET